VYLKEVIIIHMVVMNIIMGKDILMIITCMVDNFIE